ncbi:hypothetical protein IP69_11520 [Bosea sp. AAP35]|uniref:hypothetical protein n=1 Tax=Bosea sp. AAP35 TaxID=1523417 RepID=UPI0006B8B78F|nr:hypothetical protein [Bosea sp. AAP35]KPF68458.1 hypothetical protein IP69_11520 [Bosea sp. AAP35]
MQDNEAASDEIDGGSQAAIRAGLARVLASDAFRAAPQLSAFLAFIVERAVAGRSAELKGYTIAVEAFGRSASFDPQADPIVRVEAGRLRRALAQYYAGEGAADPVRITIPVGAYIPAFERLDVASATMTASGPAGEPLFGPVDSTTSGPTQRSQNPDFERRVAKRWPVMAGAALSLALLSLGAWHGGLLGRDTATRGAALPIAGPATAVGPNISAPAAALETTILVISLPDPPGDPGLAATARRFSSFLVDALSRFDDLVTVKMPQVGEALPAGADYVFEVTGETVDGAMESFARLRSVRDGRIVWSAASTRAFRADDADVPDIARRLAARLAEPFGIIHADIRQNPDSGPMPCIYRAMDFRRVMAKEDHLAARNCLQELVRRDPTFYPAWAQLSFLSQFEYNFGFNALPEPPLERALSEALTAVRLAPSSARAQQVMMIALFARGAAEEGLRAGQLAMSRNPYDSDILATLGARYIQLNRPAEGLPLVEKAIQISAGRPPSYDFFAFLGAHLLNAQQVSRAHGEFLGDSTHPYALLGRAIRAVQRGNMGEKTEALTKLCSHYPLFEADPQQWLMRRGFGAAVIKRILDDLGLQ